eukprot:CFRG3922T1
MAPRKRKAAAASRKKKVAKVDVVEDVVEQDVEAKNEAVAEVDPVVEAEEKADAVVETGETEDAVVETGETEDAVVETGETEDAVVETGEKEDAVVEAEKMADVVVEEIGETNGETISDTSVIPEIESEIQIDVQEKVEPAPEVECEVQDKAEPIHTVDIEMEEEAAEKIPEVKPEVQDEAEPNHTPTDSNGHINQPVAVTNLSTVAQTNPTEKNILSTTSVTTENAMGINNTKSACTDAIAVISTDATSGSAAAESSVEEKIQDTDGVTSVAGDGSVPQHANGALDDTGIVEHLNSTSGPVSDSPVVPIRAWPPVDTTNDGTTNDVKNTDTDVSLAANGESKRKRKKRSRWGGEEDKVVVAGVSLSIPQGLTPSQQETYLLHLNIEEINKKLRSEDLGIPKNPADRSPSPPPIYDQHGKRLNTREQRVRTKLEEERHDYIQKALEVNPDYRPPADYKPQAKRYQDRVDIPQDAHPHVNFIGLLIGPRGNTLKKMERESGAKIMIRGKGSVKEGKGRRDGAPIPGENEQLHAMIAGPDAVVVKKGVDLVVNIIKVGIETPDSANELKSLQLRELAALNGTLREELTISCSNCGSLEHRHWQCTERKNAVQTIVCSVCGGHGHIGKDCSQRVIGGVPNQGGDDTQNIDNEYLSFMAELEGGGGNASVESTETSATRPALMASESGSILPSSHAKLSTQRPHGGPLLSAPPGPRPPVIVGTVVGGPPGGGALPGAGPATHPSRAGNFVPHAGPPRPPGGGLLSRPSQPPSQPPQQSHTGTSRPPWENTSQSSAPWEQKLPHQPPQNSRPPWEQNKAPIPPWEQNNRAPISPWEQNKQQHQQPLSQPPPPWEQKPKATPTAPWEQQKPNPPPWETRQPPPPNAQPPPPPPQQHNQYNQQATQNQYQQQNQYRQNQLPPPPAGNTPWQQNSNPGWNKSQYGNPSQPPQWQPHRQPHQGYGGYGSQIPPPPPPQHQPPPPPPPPAQQPPPPPPQ